MTSHNNNSHNPVAIMMLSSTDVLQQALDRDLVDSDLKAVEKYVKNVLFERVCYLWKRSSLDEGGLLHKDYLKNCRSLIADGQLANLNDNVDFKPYMNILWAIMKKDGCYNTWLSSKRSNTYQALLNSFQSELFACLLLPS